MFGPPVLTRRHEVTEGEIMCVCVSGKGRKGSD